MTNIESQTRTRDEIMKNNELLNNIFLTYNHSEGTQRIYIYALEKYSSNFGMSLQELLNEAESEESAGIKWKHSV